jgi:hypothetical protein
MGRFIMESLRDYMLEYRKQLEKGHVQEAYRGLMGYIMDLRMYLKNKYPEYFISGIYQGYMDMTYFSFTPDSLKSLKLKIAVVFIYDTFKFEVWLDLIKMFKKSTGNYLLKRAWKSTTFHHL